MHAAARRDIRWVWDKKKVCNLALNQVRTELGSCFERGQTIDWHTSVLPVICSAYRYFIQSLDNLGMLRTSLNNSVQELLRALFSKLSL